MLRLMLAGALLIVLGTGSFAADRYWVVGDHATGKCQIVTSNPVIAGDIWFGDGPYTSEGDAKLARSTIGACPKGDTEDDKDKEPSADATSANK